MKRIIGLSILIIIIVLLPLFGCASSSSSVEEIPAIGMPAPMPPSESPRFQIFEDSANKSTGGSSWQQDSGYYGEDLDIERKIIKTGFISLVVEDVTESLDEISNIASTLGGYVVSSSKSEGKNIISGNVAIRIPAQKYDEAISLLRDIAVQIPNESTDSQDVTEEYIDLTARLATLEATEAQYLELLKRAETVEEVLKVQQAISNVRQDIESLKGRIQYIERTSDMSLINVNLREEETFTEAGWQPLEILKSAVRGLATFGKVLLNILIWIAVFIPLWIVIGVIVWLILRRRKKMKANS